MCKRLVARILRQKIVPRTPMARMALMTVAAILAAAVPAAAVCMARSHPLQWCEIFWTYDAVFDGTVTKLVENEGDANARSPIMQRQHRVVTFDVHRQFWGKTGGPMPLVLGGGSTLQYAESFSVRTGQRYLIFARRFSADSPLSTTGCDPSAMIHSTSAKDALRFLENLSAPSRGARVYGTIDGSELSGSRGRASRQFQVVLEDDKTRRVRTTVGGKFDFGPLRPGTYGLYIRVPEWPNGRGAVPTTVTLPHSHACARQDIVLADK